MLVSQSGEVVGVSSDGGGGVVSRRSLWGSSNWSECRLSNSLVSLPVGVNWASLGYVIVMPVIVACRGERGPGGKRRAKTRIMSVVGPSKQCRVINSKQSRDR